ncbi:hypothetical protein Leryth_013259 [Lithospermum erythrorhizon]|nr:hypothetical protein Leryth_013259 [Lithospermum erythrorhizon]
MEDVQLYTNWDDILCPICLDFPHNCVLLQCSSHEQGCRPFVCDTNHLHSNCLDRFKQAHGAVSRTELPSSNDGNYLENTTSAGSEANNGPICPLCRGEVTGWKVLDSVRVYLNEKKRCCEEEKCAFEGAYKELCGHAELEHPHARPSKVDPDRQLDWDNFQQSSEIIDVLSTIHAEVPRGVVFGDYVIEYGDENSDDDSEDCPGDKRNWWTSCILYQVFDNFRSSRNRRRSRVSDMRRGNRRLTYETSNSDEGSVTSIEYTDHRADEIDDELVNVSGLTRSRAGHRRTKSH